MSGLTIISMESGSLVIGKQPYGTRVWIEVYDGPVMQANADEDSELGGRPNFSDVERLRTVRLNKTDLNLLINTLKSHL